MLLQAITFTINFFDNTEITMLANIKSLIVVVAFLQIVLALLDETYGPYGYKGEKPYL